ncbi:MAG: cation:proton antiporter [Euryarchaeota archaeon]|nr:cation:proton antiporter [Euryarchaeota archaeon]MDE1835540.1 cation:proton antiporter [Euryarchaeota archaeon]MDE1879631.1 cation:proton antiporter [Euryarchaeota archaeon]MDE2043838.1 cation:proton antiporter [Thermoplasmata archaeon]
MTSTAFVLAVAGGALLVAFTADVIARRLGFPDVLFVLAVGVLVGLAGPTLHFTISTLLSFAPYLGTAALALILFDAGLDLEESKLENVPSNAALLAVLSVGLAFAVTFPVAYLYLTGRSLLLSLVFAGALSCTSSAVVVPVASRMSLPSTARSIVHVSSALEDTIAVVLVTTLMVLLLPASNGVPVVALVLLPLPLGALGGFLGGLAWIEATLRWQNRPFFSMATVGFLFALVGAVTALGGAGILSALVFGVVLGNGQWIRDRLKWKGDFVLMVQVRQFQTEVAFLLRAFFMLVLGMLVGFAAGSLELMLVGGVLAALVLATRATAVEGFLRISKRPRSWNLPFTALGARGLTSAVLVILPVTVGLVPSTASFLTPTLVVVVATVAATSIGVLLYERVPSIHDGSFGERVQKAPMSREDLERLYRSGPGGAGTTHPSQSADGPMRGVDRPPGGAAAPGSPEESRPVVAAAPPLFDGQSPPPLPVRPPRGG